METEKILLDVEFDANTVQQAITAIQGYRNEQDLLRASQKELAAQGLQNTEQYIKQESAIKALSNQVKSNQRVVDANATSQRKVTGYVDSLKKSISELTVQFDKLTKEELENVEIGGKLQKQLKSQSDELRNIKAGAGDTRLEVGRYKEGFIEAGKQINIAGVNVGNTFKDLDEINQKFFGTMIQGFEESGLKAKFFGNALRTTLTLTGIGLFLIALATMVAYWDDIAEAIGLAESSSEKYFKKQLADIEASRTALEQLNKELEAQNAILEILGDKETEIFSNKRKSLLLEIQIAEQQRDLIADRIVQYQKENSLTAENLKLRELAQRATKIPDRFIQQIGDYKKQYDKVTVTVVNLRNQLAILNAQQAKFNESQKVVTDRKLDSVGFVSDNTEIRAREQLNNKLFNEEAEHLNRMVGLSERANAFRAKLYEDDKKRKEDTEKSKQLAEQATLAGSRDIFNALAGLFDQGTAENKAFALTAIGIDTAQAISGLTSASEQNPLNAVTFSAAGIAQYAAGIVRILANIGKAKQLLNFAQGGLVDPLIEGFAGGGLSGRKIMPWHGRPIQRANGDNRLATVKVGEVILNERQQAALGGARTFRSINVPGFAGGGGFLRNNMRAAVDTRFDANTVTNTMKSALKDLKIYTQVSQLEKVQSQSASNKFTSELRKRN